MTLPQDKLLHELGTISFDKQMEAVEYDLARQITPIFGNYLARLYFSQMHESQDIDLSSNYD